MKGVTKEIKLFLPRPRTLYIYIYIYIYMCVYVIHHQKNEWSVIL